MLCLGFNLPQPQVSIIESKPISNFDEHVLPVLKSFNAEVSQSQDNSELLKAVFGDLNEPDLEVNLGRRKERS